MGRSCFLGQTPFTLFLEMIIDILLKLLKGSALFAIHGVRGNVSGFLGGVGNGLIRSTASLSLLKLSTLLFQPIISFLLFSFPHGQLPLLIGFQLDELMLRDRIDKRLELHINSLHLLPASLPGATTD
ncbi:hypothetical protein HG530_011378 [Fusarium avenaceum]|nr:hypothetical protein HG530_011378 [Fusarium avenaceum]